MKVHIRLLSVAVLLLVAPLGARDRLTLRVTPAVSFEPANLIVRTNIEHSDDNRSVEIIAESADFYRSSEVSLDGSRAPRTNVFEFRSLPGGTYQVRAVLKGANGRELATAAARVNVMSAGGEFQGDSW
jgi:hypothetical protein